MSGKIEIVRTIAPLAAPFTAAIVEQWVKPKLAALHKYIKADKALFENALASKFDEYLQRSYEKNSYISVIVFQNQQQKLKELYLPLTIQSSKDNGLINIDAYKDEFVPAYKNVLITDTAGMGKSTLMKYLFLSCIERNRGIPVFIELRKLTSDKTILDIIYNELNPIDDEFDRDFILKLIKRGDFIFFLDGYDEIPFNQREDVVGNLQDFISKADSNCFILTSRPESSLASFPDFQRFRIKPLKPEEAFELLRKYDKTGELSEEIIKKLKDPSLKNIQEFLTNPLLVSLLYKSYEYKPILHFKKHIFYRQVYDSLFESHDLTKGGGYVRQKRSGLDIEEFHRVLRTLGYITVTLGEIEYDRDKILSLLNEAKEYSPGLDFKASQFLEDLIGAVPLFDKDGDYYKWAHKSIQEYFAAQFICFDAKGKQDEILLAMYKSDNIEKYYNVLDLCYDIDYKTFRRTIVYDLINTFLQHYNSSYKDISRKLIREDDIHERKVITFQGPFVLMSHSYLEAEVLNYSAEKFLKSLSRLLGYKITLDRIGSITYSSHERPSILYTPKTYIRPIMSLLQDKKDEIIRSSIVAVVPNVIWRRKKPLLIDDKPASEANKKAMFVKVNKLLQTFRMPTMDIEKCKALKIEIEEEKKKESSKDFLISSI